MPKTIIQDYAPQRHALIQRDELRTLTRLSPGRVVADTIAQWTVIVAAWALAAWRGEWWVDLAMIGVVGTRFYALYIIGHDGLHRRLFESQRANDLWNDVFVLAPIGAITRLNRGNHMRHHARCALAGDPDHYKYDESRIARGPAWLIWSLTGVPYLLRAVANVFSRSATTVARDDDVDPAARPRYVARDLLILAGVNTALVAGLTATFGWYGYPLFWMLPVFVFTYAADINRVFLEHSLLPCERSPARMVTVECNWLERQLFAPMNMNLHVAHHLYPAIPYYRLPEADALIKARESRLPGTVRRRGYFRLLVQCLRLSQQSAQTVRH